MSVPTSPADDGGLDALPARPTTDTWRYFGDRDAADRAFCARFGVPEAPEPVRVIGGAWAYAVPPQRDTR